MGSNEDRHQVSRRGVWLAIVVCGVVGSLATAGPAAAQPTTVNFGVDLLGTTSVTMTATVTIPAGDLYTGPSYPGPGDDTSDFTVNDSNCQGGRGLGGTCRRSR